jgi:hypothetical protein
VTLCVEHVDAIRATQHQAERRSRARVQHERGSLLRVYASQIDGQVLVDKHPQIVIARVSERLAAIVREQ